MKRNYFSHWLLALILVVSSVADQGTIAPFVGHKAALPCGIASRIFKGAAKKAGKDAAKKTGKEAAKKAGKESAKKGTKDAAKQGAKDCAKKEAQHGAKESARGPGGVSPDYKRATKENGQSTPGNMQKEVDRGQAPSSIEGVNRGRVENEKDHVHFDDNRELTNDGHWRGGDGRDVTRKEREWLEKHGWEIPEKKDPAAQVSK